MRSKSNATQTTMCGVQQTWRTLGPHKPRRTIATVVSRVSLFYRPVYNQLPAEKVLPLLSPLSSASASLSIHTTYPAMASSVPFAASKTIPGQAQENISQQSNLQATGNAFGVEDMFKQIMEVVTKSVNYRTYTVFFTVEVANDSVYMIDRRAR